MVDHLELILVGGRGGNGAVSFLRQKYRPKGPPDGGDGGEGGSVFVVGSRNLLTLYDLSAKKRYIAPNGTNGRGANKHGKNASALFLKVPLGTIVTELASQMILGDIIQSDQKVLISRGGKGGRGNARFKTSRNRSPQMAERGEEGEIKRVTLDLKIIADIGLVGLPNAGKSTLLNAITNASSPVGSHPFTTKSPQLGVIMGLTPLVVADIPGLIAGAAAGRGLGDSFLRHIERTRLILHLIDPSVSTNVWQDYQKIRKELTLFSAALGTKKELVVLTKGDLSMDLWQKYAAMFQQKGIDTIVLSAQSGHGLKFLLNTIRDQINTVIPPTITKATPSYNLDTLSNKRIIFKS